jgi:hypothetical protein
MDRATRGGLIVSAKTLAEIPPDELEEMGVTVKRVRRQVFSPRQSGVPVDLEMYRLKSRRETPGEDPPPDAAGAADDDDDEADG